MKCARCGHEIDPCAERCEWCARGASAAPFSGSAEHGEDGEAPVRCPVCGSTRVSAVRRGYDPGCGCLGVLLFSWIGLLLGFLGADRVDMVCLRCGNKWEPGSGIPRSSCLAEGCWGLLLLLLLLLVLLGLFFAFSV